MFKLCFCRDGVFSRSCTFGILLIRFTANSLSTACDYLLISAFTLSSSGDFVFLSSYTYVKRYKFSSSFLLANYGLRDYRFYFTKMLIWCSSLLALAAMAIWLSWLSGCLNWCWMNMDSTKHTCLWLKLESGSSWCSSTQESIVINPSFLS